MTDLARALDKCREAEGLKATDALLAQAAEEAATPDVINAARRLAALGIRGLGPLLSLEVIAAIGRVMCDEGNDGGNDDELV